VRSPVLPLMQSETTFCALKQGWLHYFTVIVFWVWHREELNSASCQLGVVSPFPDQKCHARASFSLTRLTSHLPSGFYRIHAVYPDLWLLAAA